MKLKKLKALIDSAVEFAAETDPDVEVWTVDDEPCEIKRVGQFGVMPTVVITIEVETTNAN